MKKVKQVYPTEHEEQSDFVKWFELQFPHIRLFSVPNGLRTGFKQASKAKREGMRKGVPDLWIPELRVVIEFKRVKGGALSPDQKDWLRYLEDRCDMNCFVAYGCDEAIKFMLKLTRKN